MAKEKVREIVGKTEAVEEVKKAAPKSSLPSIQPIGDDEIGAPEIAKILGVNARDFRAFLRAKKRDMTVEKGTRYAWKRDSEEVEAIMEEYKEFVKNKPVKEAKPKTEKKVKAKKAAEVAEAEVIDTDLEEVDELSLDDIDLDD